MYSLGLYIHECPKMRYKGTFDGTSLLCPYTRLFVPFPLTVKGLEAKSPILCPDKEVAERVHEESVKKGEEFIHSMPYLHYKEGKYHVRDWDALQEYPESGERVRAIQNCIPRCGGYLFLFSCSVSSFTNHFVWTNPTVSTLPTIRKRASPPTQISQFEEGADASPLHFACLDCKLFVGNSFLSTDSADIFTTSARTNCHLH